MALSEKQRKFLRGKAHALEPVVMIGGSGLSEGVIRETERALEDHEIIKVRVRAGERGARDEIIERLAQQTGAQLVHRIGHVAVFYRPRREPPRMVIPGD